MARLIKAKLAAEYLGASRQTLAHWRVRGDGPPYAKLGGRIVYDLSDLESWVSVRSFKSTSEYPER